MSSIHKFGEDCLDSSQGATRLVTVQKVMVFGVFHDGDVSGRNEFAMAEEGPETSYICEGRSSRWASDRQ